MMRHHDTPSDITYTYDSLVDLGLTHNDPILPGHVEADETWTKVGEKYPGRGRHIDKSDSMVKSFSESSLMSYQMFC